MMDVSLNIFNLVNFFELGIFINCKKPITEYRNGWVIKTVTKSFAVYAATATEKQEWMAHITKCIEDLLRKSKKFTYLKKPTCN